jgi:ribosomal protein S18 acetylase RimI-like enzyme
VSAATNVEIVDYSRRFGDAFGILNREWLERYFQVEPIDHEILADPEGAIINDGGVILYLLMSEAVVGTVALKHQGDGVYELTKMAVTADHQGQGLGRQLLSAAIKRFTDLGGKMLYLESHSSLTQALVLYESAGFQHQTPPSPSEYERADVYMVFESEQRRFHEIAVITRE